MLTRRQWGVSLVELLISMAIGLAIITAAVSFYTDSLRLGGNNLRQGHLAAELRAAMLYMTREVRRAGYSGVVPGSDLDGDGLVDEADLALLYDNPFFTRHDLTVGRYDPAEAEDSCLLFSYNLDADEEAAAMPPRPRIGVCDSCAPPAPYHLAPYDRGNVELMGFRLRDGAIERRSGGVSSLDCTGRGDQWQDVTSAEVVVEELRFVVHSTGLNVRNPAAPCVTGLPCLYERTVDVRVTGVLAHDPASRMTLEETIAIRNSKYVISAP